MTYTSSTLSFINELFVKKLTGDLYLQLSKTITRHLPPFPKTLCSNPLRREPLSVNRSNFQGLSRFIYGLKLVHQEFGN